MNYQGMLQKDRVPSSKINDYLPRNILDEIQIKTPKTSQSFKELPNDQKPFFPISQSRKNTTSTTISHGLTQESLYPSQMFYNNPSMNPYRTFSANQLSNQQLFFPPNRCNMNYNSFTTASKYNNFSQLLPQQNQILMNNQIYSFQQTFPKESLSTLTESQIDSLSGITSIKVMLDNSPVSLIHQYIKTSKGSRHFQKMISSSPPSQYETDMLVNIICKTITDVMCDYYGNYFLQKFFPYCSLNHRLLFYTFIKPHFSQIANHICGNHSLQCLIMLQNSKEEMNIIKECVEHNLQSLSFRPNSCHVIQKVIKAIKESNRDYINAFIISNLIYLCTDSNGICIVKEFISNLENEFYIMAFVSILELEVNKLTYDQYGNFCIQEIIKKFGFVYCKKIITKIIDHVFMFSISKYSSNVVDCVISHLYNNDINAFYSLVTKMFFEENCLNEMLKNKYATYVIENCLTLLFSVQPNNNNYATIQRIVYQILIKKQGIMEKKKIYKLIQTFASS